MPETLFYAVLMAIVLAIYLYCFAKVIEFYCQPAFRYLSVIRKIDAIIQRMEKGKTDWKPP